MAGAGSVVLTYTEMEDNCKKLDQYLEQFTSLANDVTACVNSFSGAWEGQAEAVFEEDYNTLATSLNQAFEVMGEINRMAMNYVNDMKAVEEAYGKGSHVSIN